MMKISKCMTRDVQLASPTQSIQDAAKMMAEIDAGSLPVGQDNRLVGMITDRDIAIRAVAEGKSPDTPVREVMSQEVLYCFDDQELEDVPRAQLLPHAWMDKRATAPLANAAHPAWRYWTQPWLSSQGAACARGRLETRCPRGAWTD